MTIRTTAYVYLESGDHLTQAEFHRRYLARPDINRAELIEGVVYVGGRVPAREHGEPHASMAGWIGVYLMHVRNPALKSGSAPTVILDELNEVQPDAVLWWPKPGGPRVNDEGIIEGPPQLIVEVAASSFSKDLHQKKEAYRRNKVREYVVWRVLDGAIDWFELRDGAYVLREPGADGIVESSQFPGLRLHVPSMLADDVTGVLAALSPTEPT
jgi:Uma2 family endonuclease